MQASRVRQARVPTLLNAESRGAIQFLRRVRPWSRFSDEPEFGLLFQRRIGWRLNRRGTGDELRVGQSSRRS